MEKFNSCNSEAANAGIKFRIFQKIFAKSVVLILAVNLNFAQFVKFSTRKMF